MSEDLRERMYSRSEVLNLMRTAIISLTKLKIHLTNEDLLNEFDETYSESQPPAGQEEDIEGRKKHPEIYKSIKEQESKSPSQSIPEAPNKKETLDEYADRLMKECKPPPIGEEEFTQPIDSILKIYKAGLKELWDQAGASIRAAGYESQPSGADESELYNLLKQFIEDRILPHYERATVEQALLNWEAKNKKV
jgi:hypothetical protein